MFSIFITAKALADVYLQEKPKSYKEQSEWFHILLKQKEIFTTGYSIPSGDIIEEDDLSDSGIIAEMASAYNIKFTPSDEYLESVLNDNAKVYDYPNAAFFLDVTQEVANDIQDKFGVICQPTNHVDTSVFTEECIRHVFEKNRPVNGGWNELLEVQSQIPSNSMCIIDRFLFVYDGSENRNKREELIYNGLDTVMLILNYALPEKFSQTYHLTVICDKDHIKNNLDFQALQKELFKRVNIVAERKGYPIFSQLIAVDRKQAPYSDKLTHNRQIVSNYHRMGFDNGINAIRLYYGANNSAEYTQTIQGELLYDTGLKKVNSECPADTIHITQKDGNYIFSRWMSQKEEDFGHFLYADNLGNTSIKNFKNMFFI